MNIPFIENGINIKKWIRFPKLNNERKIRILIVIIVIIYMIINSFYGQAAVHYKVKCFEDLSHKFTKKINNYFLVHTNLNFFIKFCFSILIDLSIIYTLIVWSLYSTNIRLISSLLTYIIINILIKFIHIQIQPENSAFYKHRIFSIFINYNKNNYSFYPMGIGLLIICGFEWKRNDNDIYFYFFVFLFFSESFILVIMEGSYFHEIFTSGITGHYFFLINENILKLFFGKEYLNNKIVNNNSKSFELNNDNNKDKLRQNAERIKIELKHLDEK